MYSIENKLKNEDELWKEVEAQKTYLEHFPPRLTFQTHQRCNFSCRLCYHFTNKYYNRRAPEEMEVMSLDQIKKVADELFPTLQYCEATLLGDPFLSPNFDEEMKLYRKYNVFFRPTTNMSLVTEKKLEQVDGVRDWLKCSFDSHIRSVYNQIKIGVRHEKVVEKLKMFAKKRHEMNPVPYFRVGFVLMDLNYEHLPEYMIWCQEELGVDDVEFMCFNVDHYQMESLHVFDQADNVNRICEKAIETAIDRKIKLRMAFTQMPYEGATGEDRWVSEKRAERLRAEQAHLGFIPPREFEKMSYVIRNPRHRGEIGDLGYAWSNDMRRTDICEEFFNRPFIIWNGNVEACGNCNTFHMGNMFEQDFKDIWNSDFYQDIRRRMYAGPVKTWYRPCQNCICMHVTYDRATSDHRFSSFYRINEIEGKELAKKVKDMEAEGIRKGHKIPVKERVKGYIPPKFLPAARRAYRLFKKAS